MAKKLKELFFDKVDNSTVVNSEDIKLLVECFNTFYCSNCKRIILLDSNGIFLASKDDTLLELKEHSFKYINKIKGTTQSIIQENTLVKVFKSNKIQDCPLFYILVQPTDKADLNIIDIGLSLQKSFLHINSYRLKNKTMCMYLDSIQEGISAVDKNGIVVYANDTCCNILGTSKEKILNRKADSLCTNQPLLYDILKTKKSKIDTEYFLEYNDKPNHLISSGYPTFDENGNLCGAIDIFKSINRSRKLVNIFAGNNATFEFKNIIGKSKQITSTIEIAKKYALHSENILVEGESGTGKELFTQSIHNYSSRRKGPFIAINCANLPKDLVESELFGYEEGTFTGAKKGGKPGKFELANGGTLFLDEIGEMQLHLQSKLLRAVEYKSINRIGSNRVMNVDVRIIAATNRNLEVMIKEGKFRSDLYYRLKVLSLKIPSLKERDEDILELSNHFIRKIGQQMGKNINGIDTCAKEILLSYDWPGNIRELENCMARVIFFCDENVIKRNHLIKAGIPNTNFTHEIINHRKSIDMIDYSKVKEVYESVSCNKKRTAELLGISRPTLYKILKQHNIK